MRMAAIDLMIKFKNALADALRCYLEPYFDNEDELFVDTRAARRRRRPRPQDRPRHVRERRHDPDLHAQVRVASLYPPRARQPCS